MMTIADLCIVFLITLYYIKKEIINTCLVAWPYNLSSLLLDVVDLE